MPHIPEAFKRPATVTTHVVDDHDAPGGTDLEAQLLHDADPGPRRIGSDGPLEQHVDGFRFPARPGHPPVTAEVATREPWTAPEISLEIPPDRGQLHDYGMESEAHLEPDQADNEQTPISLPLRKLVTLQRIRVAGQVTLDGTGAGTVELTPGQWGGGAPGAGAGVQQNQRWLLDRIVARGAAAGQVLVYAGAVANDHDLVAALTLAAGSFAGQVDGNAVQLNPGWRVAAVFANAGAAGIATCVAFYRVGVYAPGYGEEV